MQFNPSKIAGYGAFLSFYCVLDLSYEAVYETKGFVNNFLGFDTFRR